MTTALEGSRLVHERVNVVWLAILVGVASLSPTKVPPPVWLGSPLIVGLLVMVHVLPTVRLSTCQDRYTGLPLRTRHDEAGAPLSVQETCRGAVTVGVSSVQVLLPES